MNFIIKAIWSLLLFFAIQLNTSFAQGSGESCTGHGDCSSGECCQYSPSTGNLQCDTCTQCQAAIGNICADNNSNPECPRKTVRCSCSGTCDNFVPRQVPDCSSSSAGSTPSSASEPSSSSSTSSDSSSSDFSSSSSSSSCKPKTCEDLGLANDGDGWMGMPGYCSDEQYYDQGCDESYPSDGCGGSIACCDCHIMTTTIPTTTTTFTTTTILTTTTTSTTNTTTTTTLCTPSCPAGAGDTSEALQCGVSETGVENEEESCGDFPDGCGGSISCCTCDCTPNTCPGARFPLPAGPAPDAACVPPAGPDRGFMFCDPPESDGCYGDITCCGCDCIPDTCTAGTTLESDLACPNGTVKFCNPKDDGCGDSLSCCVCLPVTTTTILTTTTSTTTTSTTSTTTTSTTTSTTSTTTTSTTTSTTSTTTTTIPGSAPIASPRALIGIPGT